MLSHKPSGGTMAIDRQRAQLSRVREIGAIDAASNEMLQKLARTEARYRNLVENAPDGFWEIDTDLRIANISHEMARQLGYEPDELVNAPLDTVMAPQAVATVAASIQNRGSVERIGVKTDVKRLEFDCRRRDGSTFPAETYSRPLRDADGRITGFFGVTRDVTARKRLEAEIRDQAAVAERSEQHLATAQRIGRVGSIEVELSPEVARWSDEMYELAGLDRKGGASFERFLSALHPDDRAEMKADRERLARGEALAPREYRFLHDDGSICWTYRQVEVLRDRDQHPVGHVSTYLDITARKLAEARFAQQDAQLRGYRDHLNIAQRVGMIGSSAIDLKTGKSQWSDALYELTGLDPATTQPGAQAILDLVHPDDREMLSNQRAAWVSGEAKPAAEWRLIRPDGELRWFESHGESVTDGEGRVTKLIVTFQDITDRKRIQAERTTLERQLMQAQKMEAIGRLTGGIAHDFNNLLTVIIGRLSLVASDLKDRPELEKWLTVCIKAANRGASLTRSLLAYARQQPLMPVKLSVAATLGELIELLPHTLGENIEVRTDFAKELWWCEVDPSQLQNAVLNLALNARDAMPEGGRLTIGASNVRAGEELVREHRYVVPGDYVVLSIADTGVGIAPAVMERVFEPFFTTKEVGKGSGLGLSMVYGFVKQSGGHVTIHSEPGIGTTLRLYLPRCAAPAGAVESEPREVAPQSGKERILVVEDDDDMRDLVATILGKLGYRVLTASRGDEALALLAAHPDVALLLSDVTLPGTLGGRALAERCKQASPGLKTLYMSGYSSDDIFVRGRLDLGVRLLRKPFDIKMLAEEVRAAMNGP